MPPVWWWNWINRKYWFFRKNKTGSGQGENFMRCPHCGEETFPKKKNIMSGWTIAKVVEVCAFCNKELSVPCSESGQNSVSSAVCSLFWKRTKQRFFSCGWCQKESFGFAFRRKRSRKNPSCRKRWPAFLLQMPQLYRTPVQKYLCFDRLGVWSNGRVR